MNRLNFWYHPDPNCAVELPDLISRKAIKELRGLYVASSDPLVFYVVAKFQEVCGSGAELGRRVNFHANTIYDWLHKRKKCPLEAFIKCCEGTNINHVKLLKNGLSVYGQNRSRGRLSLKPTPKIFWFYGVVATDGYNGRCKGGRVQVTVYQKNHRFLAEVKKVGIKDLSVAFSGPHLDKGRNEYRIASRSRILSEMLRVFGGVPLGKKSGRGSSPPKLPLGISMLPPEFLAAYLGGVVEGDGSVVRGDWYICSYHKSFLEELPRLVRIKLKVVSTLGHKTRGNEFDLYFPANERKKLFYWICRYLSHPKKIEDMLRIVRG